MRVNFNRGALTDLTEILDYTASRDPAAAAKLSRRFEEAAELLGFSPEIGAPTSRPGFRRIVVANYLMVYEAGPSGVTIHYVRHGARRRPWEGEN